MKKWIVCVVILTLCLTLAGCEGKKEEGKAPEPSTNGQKLLADFQEKAAGEDYGTTEELAAALLENELLPFDGATMAVEPGLLNGFTGEITGFSEGTMFGPVISTIPFVGYVFRLEDGADVDAFLRTLKEKGDLRWNICTEADELVCDAVDNRVFFVMCPAEFEDSGNE